MQAKLKRFAVVTLAVSLSLILLVGSTFASSGELPVSYSELPTPSEELQIMTSGDPVSMFATDPESGYSMTLNGVEQKVAYTVTETSTNEAASGYAYYGSYLLPIVPTVSGYPYYCIKNDGAGYFRCYYSSVPFVRSYYDFALLPYSTSQSAIKEYGLSSTSGSWSFNEWINASVTTTGVPVCHAGAVSFTNHDIYNWSYDNKAITDVLFKAAQVPSTSSDITEEVEKNISFPSSDMATVSGVEHIVSLLGDSVTGEISGDQTYSFTATEPYIDVEIPIEQFVYTYLTDEEYDSISLSGTVAFDLAVGLWSSVSGEDKIYYAISDLVPDSIQLIINGSPLGEDFFSAVPTTDSRSDSGYKSSVNISTGHIDAAVISSDDTEDAKTVTIWTDDGTAVEIATIGFRIYLTSASGGAATTFNNSYTFDSVTPYAYINFTTEDGESGLPTVNFYTANSGGDSGDDSGDSGDDSGGSGTGGSGGTDSGSCDHSGIIGWLEKIYNKMVSWFASTDAYFAEELPILNSILTAIEENSTVSSISQLINVTQTIVTPSEEDQSEVNEFEQQIQDQITEADKIQDTINSLDTPPPVEIVPDVSTIVTSQDAAIYSDALSGLFKNSMITNMLLIGLGICFVSYVLFGKK